MLEDLVAQTLHTRYNKLKRNDTPLTWKIRDESHLTSDIRGSLNKLLYQCRVMFLVNLYRDNMSKIIKSV